MALHVYTTIYFIQYFIQKQALQVGTPKKEPQVQFKAVVCLGTYFSREIFENNGD